MAIVPTYHQGTLAQQVQTDTARLKYRSIRRTYSMCSGMPRSRNGQGKNKNS